MHDIYIIFFFHACEHSRPGLYASVVNFEGVGNMAKHMKLDEVTNATVKDTYRLHCQLTYLRRGTSKRF